MDNMGPISIRINIIISDHPSGEISQRSKNMMKPHGVNPLGDIISGPINSLYRNNYSKISIVMVNMACAGYNSYMKLYVDGTCFYTDGSDDHLEFNDINHFIKLFRSIK